MRIWIVAFGSIPYIVEAWGGARSWQDHLSKLFAVAFVVMLPATLLMGLLFGGFGQSALFFERLSLGRKGAGGLRGQRTEIITGARFYRIT